jgi:hypothetical protein
MKFLASTLKSTNQSMMSSLRFTTDSTPTVMPAVMHEYLSQLVERADGRLYLSDRCTHGQSR